jgi:hypothetical protein
VLLLFLAAGIACRQAGPPLVVDAGAAACITGDTVALAGVDLDRLRASPFVNGLGGSARDFLAQYAKASRLLAGWNAHDLILVARGTFSTPPAGARVVEPGLAVTGAPSRVLFALAQHQSGRSGALDLIEYGSQIGAQSAIWLAVRGGKPLPLSGNVANLNHLLENADFAGAALELGGTATLRFGARARTAESAAQLEERLRGFLSLAGEAEIHRPELAQLLSSARIEHSGSAVSATLIASPDALAKLLTDFAR